MTKKLTFNEKPIEETTSFWNLLTTDERQFLKSNLTVHYYNKNELIHCEGESGTHMMILAHGKVKIYKSGVGSRIQIVRMLKPGESFGYRSIIANEHHNTNAMAFESSMVYLLRANAFLTVLKHNNAFCYYFLELLSYDLGISDIRSVNLTQKHIRGRLAETLLLLKKNYGFESDGTTINIHLSREDLASYSNMTTSNAIRTLSNFSNEHIIALDGRKLKILDEDRLIKISRLG